MWDHVWLTGGALAMTIYLFHRTFLFLTVSASYKIGCTLINAVFFSIRISIEMVHKSNLKLMCLEALVPKWFHHKHATKPCTSKWFLAASNSHIGLHFVWMMLNKCFCLKVRNARSLTIIHSIMWNKTYKKKNTKKNRSYTATHHNFTKRIYYSNSCARCMWTWMGDDYESRAQNTNHWTN